LLYTVPASVAEALSLSHQVQPGALARYVHKIRTPEYLDTLDEPYARFVFKYRHKGEGGPYLISHIYPLGHQD
jgi:hypothetical protein